LKCQGSLTSVRRWRPFGSARLATRMALRETPIVEVDRARVEKLPTAWTTADDDRDDEAPGHEARKAILEGEREWEGRREGRSRTVSG
jgi:hypothetical protein